MHSIRPRPICRAHNTFSPSIALWQHFIAPNQHLLQWQLKSSFATEATRTRDDEAHNRIGESEAVGLEHVPAPRTLITRVKTGKGHFELNRALYPKLRNIDEQARSGRQPGKYPRAAEKLLLKAKEAYETAQDYQGVTVQPIHTKVPVKESKLPWFVKNWESTRSGEERLALEIQAFHEYARPNRAESIARKQVIEQLRKHVREILPGYLLEVFGSERTGLAFAGSDIDLRLVPKDVLSDAARAKLPPTPEERARLRKDLRYLHTGLMREHRYTYLLPRIRWARYPLISLQDRASGLDVQIVLSNDTSISRDFIQRYMTEYDYLPQLYSVIKATLDIRGLSDVFRGGIGSYSLFMMIVASLKHKPHPHNDASGALIFFLRFWGSFRAEDHGVSIEPVEFFDKSEQLVMHAKAIGHIEEGKTPSLPPWMLTLRDPADKTNDLGRKAIAWKHIRKTFGSLSEKLRTDLAVNTRPSLLAPMVGPIYMLHQTHRKRLTEYGQSVANQNQIAALAAPAAPAAGTVEQVTRSIGQKPAHFKELAAIAQAIREGETANAQLARDAKACDTTQTENQRPREDVTEQWLESFAGESGHKETGQTLSNLLGLDKNRQPSERKE